MSQTQLQQLALAISQNPAWLAGSAPITVTVFPDQGIEPVVTSDTPTVATVQMGTQDNAGVNGGNYTGEVTAVGEGTATLSYQVGNQPPVPFALVTVTLSQEGVSVSIGQPTLPGPAPT